ncbi:hypothetical protein DFH07DRAFT_957068 [Mycena maculata]|uniref:Uncharacterized protein n=1 Tax=Mycena maculata TaxID=230809 RepID=A0AAD7JCM3_9AGAR|nr:hypothetical protein DFH07DRAFT_957068 [Mycena maculata]
MAIVMRAETCVPALRFCAPTAGAHAAWRSTVILLPCSRSLHPAPGGPPGSFSPLRGSPYLYSCTPTPRGSCVPHKWGPLPAAAFASWTTHAFPQAYLLPIFQAYSMPRSSTVELAITLRQSTWRPPSADACAPDAPYSMPQTPHFLAFLPGRKPAAIPFPRPFRHPIPPLSPLPTLPPAPSRPSRGSPHRPPPLPAPHAAALFTVVATSSSRSPYYSFPFQHSHLHANFPLRICHD